MNSLEAELRGAEERLQSQAAELQAQAAVLGTTKDALAAAEEAQVLPICLARIRVSSMECDATGMLLTI